MAEDKEAPLPTGAQLTALDDAFRKDPYPVLDRLCQREPVHHDRELNRWFVTDHARVKQILRDKAFCVDARKAAEGSFARKIVDPHETPSMLGLDDPDHRRLRSFVARAFAPQSVALLRPMVERIADSVLDDLKGRPCFDLVSDYATPIPFLVLAGMLGVQASDQADFRRWADAKVQAFDPFRTDAARAEMADAERGLRAYFGRAMALRRASPRDDLLSDLVRANEEGETLSEDEIVTMCNLLIVAGIVTTSDLIGNGVLALLRAPAQLRRLREKPGLIADAVEEMLRFDSPVIQTGRIATQDCEIGGRRIAKGDSISLSLGAANRDPRVYRKPHEFDIEREDHQHLSFGGGVHMCLGAALARLEVQVAIGRLVQTFPSLRLAAVPPERKRLPILNGHRELMVLV
jgi:cytochrome P450